MRGYALLAVVGGRGLGISNQNGRSGIIFYDVQSVSMEVGG